VYLPRPYFRRKEKGESEWRKGVAEDGEQIISIFVSHIPLCLIFTYSAGLELDL